MADSVVSYSHDWRYREWQECHLCCWIHPRRRRELSGQPTFGYCRSTISDINAGYEHTLADFAEADAEARGLDNAIGGKAQSVGGSNHRDVVTLSARQVFGAFDLTIPHDRLDVNDLMIFVKEISSNGNVNTVGVIMSISPILYVLAPDYIRLLLALVMRFLATLIQAAALHAHSLSRARVQTAKELTSRCSSTTTAHGVFNITCIWTSC